MPTKAFDSTAAQLQLQSEAVLHVCSDLKYSDVCVGVSLPAQDLDLHIFSNRMMIATRCDTSPARRKMFMLSGFRLNY